MADRRPWVRPAAFAALLLAALVTSAVAAPGASAHDDLIGTAPASDAVVPAVPGVVTLTFADPPLALGLAVVVTGPGGADVGRGGPARTGSTVTQPVRAGSPAGLYTVRWRVTADDGHPTTGSFSFTALAAGGSTRSGPGAGGNPATTSISSTTSVLWLTTAATGTLALAVAAAVTTARRRSWANPRGGPRGG